MNTVEPLMFNWNGSGIQTDDNYNQRLPDRSWHETSDFLFHHAAIELCDEISPYTLQERYSEIVESEIEPIKDVLPVPERHIQIGGVSSRGNRVYYVRGETVIVPSRRRDGIVRLVSNNKNAARDLRGKLVRNLKQKAEQFYGAGIGNIEIYTSDNFTIESIEHPNASLEIERGESNDFEEQVLGELSPLSESFVSNVKVNFDDYPHNPEFDIIYASSPRRLIQVEVKDYSGTDNEPGEEDVIHKPLRKASLLNISMTVTVINGVDKEVLSELIRNSELRNQIKIVRKSEVKNSIQPLLEQSIRGGPPPRVRPPQ